MKKLFTLMLVAAGCVATTSCSDDDEPMFINPQNTSENLEGSYQLMQVNAPTAQDYDNDGDSSANLVLEGSCYNNSWISFHSDGTYDQSTSRSVAGAGGLSLDCETQLTSGTYEREGNNIVTYLNGGSSATATFTFDAQSRTITENRSNGSYSAWNTGSSLWAMLTGNLQLKYWKYTDNANDNGATADTNGENDDENNANFNLLGGFNLTSMLVASAQNLDGDGDSSTNLVTESNCYLDSQIIFHEDGTYEEHHSRALLGNLGLTLTCDSQTYYGTWSRSGDLITAHRRPSGSSSAVNTSFTFDVNTRTLIRTENNGEYAGFNLLTSLYAMLTGAIEYRYTHTEN